MAGFISQPLSPPFDEFLHFIDKHGLRCSKRKHSVVEFRDEGEFRRLKFEEMDSKGNRMIAEWEVETTYEEIQQQMSKP